ncbi:MAG: PTS glucitol/sorbitol transporter subunit IIA [Ethanoligenens sp.]|uniref:PTS glucitol/sorbitol transporter subunit IIA n=1 Tax=Ethanoligenens sp. TaxID=2099655 RepID=UPI0039E88D69
MSTVYETIVTAMGSEVNSFQDEQMFILFGPQAPDTLRDYCYVIDVNSINGNIAPNQNATIDGQTYRITAVGDLVNKNLGNLGHVTFAFTGDKHAELPGTIYLENQPLPVLQIGSKIVISA